MILMYHNFIDPDKNEIDYSPDGMTVTAHVFEKHLGYLSRYYNVICLDELLEHLLNGTRIPDNSCVITFDDGWADFATEAAPLLKKYDLPATVFLTTKYINGGNWYWEERIKFLVARIYQDRNSHGLYESSRFCTYASEKDMGSIFLEPRTEVGRWLMKAVRKLREEDQAFIDGVLQELEDIYARSESSQEPFMTWETIKDLADQKIHFGGHTVSHVNLDLTPPAKVPAELLDCRQEISERLSIDITTFAYPYGKYNTNVKQQVKEAGYRCACTTEAGFVSGESDVYALPRMNLHTDVSMTIPLFAARINRFMGIF